MVKYFSLIIILGTAILLNSCKKRIETFTPAPLSDYYPLKIGKYITYDLDSTVFVDFGKRDTVIKYQVQDKVDAEITDNSGRTAYRILRFIRKNATQQWTPNSTFIVVPSENSIEFIENNLRFLKLTLPINEGYSWKGNSYLSTDAYPSYNFSSAFMEDWDYTYQQVNTPLTVGVYNFDSTLTVFERDEMLENPQIPGQEYAEKTYSVGKYAKGIGLVYKEFLHWEYQGNDATYKGFGIKLIVTDYN